eukprot:3255744-Rhodomonas_salina.1
MWTSAKTSSGTNLSPTCLRSPYALTGTEVAYAATSRTGTDVPYVPLHRSGSHAAFAASYGPGTDVWCAAVPRAETGLYLLSNLALCSSLRHINLSKNALVFRAGSAICLRACYAMPGTCLLYTSPSPRDRG